MKKAMSDDCPCGSGKKFSVCHGLQIANEAEPEMNERHVDPNAIANFIQIFDRDELLTVSAALQLCMQNHGKNIRLESFTDEIIRKGVKNAERISYEEIREFFENHLLHDYMEDPTVSYFVENVVFYGGNYRVLPGINTDSTEILNNLLEGVFMTTNELSSEYKEKIRQATHLLLVLSEAMIDTTGLPRYSVEDIEENEIHVPEFEKLNDLIGAVRFNKNWLKELYRDFKIGEDVIDQFLITKEDLDEDHDPFDSALFSRPFFESDNEIICLIPATIAKSLSDHIKRQAKEMNETSQLTAAFFRRQWQRFNQYAHEMGWSLTDIEPPFSKDANMFIEGIFQIDRDKFAYVQMIKGQLDPSPETIANLEHIGVKKATTTDPFTERHRQVVSFLNALDESAPMKVLTLFIGAGTGGTMYFLWPKPDGDNQTLFFSFSDLEKIVFEGKLEPLTFWKYAKATGRAGKTTTFGPGSSSLDNYVHYQENGGSLLPRDQTPDYMAMMGVGTDYQRRMLAYRDEHASRQYLDNIPVDVPVRRKREYAPIYGIQHHSLQNILLIESYGIPIWVMNTEAKDRTEKKEIALYTEAVAFWLYKMTDYLKSHLSILPNLPVEVYIEIDRKLFLEHDPTAWSKNNTFPTMLEMFVEGPRISIGIPFELGSSFSEEDNNDAERSIMRTVLNGFNVLLKKHRNDLLPTELIEQTITEVMAPGHAKMILMINSDENPFLDNRGLSFNRHINEADLALIDDYLVPNLRLKTPIPTEITNPKEKNSLCLKIVNSLIARISDLLAVYDAPAILKRLVLLNEHLLYEDAANDLRMPHQIACYSDFPTAVNDLQKRNGEIIPTALAVRGLIEFVTAAPSSGTKLLDLDTMDELIALMSETIHWANVADSIDLELNDPEMGLLQSGRLGMSHEFFRDYLQPFSLSKAESEVYTMMQQHTGDSDERATQEKEPARSLYNDTVTDHAFRDEWGISLTNIFLILMQLKRIGMSAGSSFMVMNEQDLLAAIQIDLVNKIPIDELKTGLALLSLDKRPALGKAPKGFDSKDILPWRYNRALSYNRRPLIKMSYPSSGETFYHWGFRHAQRADDNLRTLITGGRLIVKKGGPIEKDVLTYYRHKKGKKFRAQVYGWLKTNTNLNVVEYEVSIHEKGVLIADRNYGDIDVMAIDHERKIIYAIECKNTLTARAIHEMKTELDNYIGKDGESGHIQMHLNRDTWLKANKNQLTKFIKDPEIYEIKSLVLTSNVIPVLYLAKNKSALPIFSFPDLVRNGFEIFL